ncbi:hypothetical protein HY04AAS1_0440 [Hydrogenobaculum sp. Y04AAS1]|uniref:DUF465 domain-containing protein n=1 Tax=Hydrogenobaculum sp. (strain Y04AAS1) TaxID=380749 RepID=UPI00015BCA75|nr:hypothetical protein HY04AAS1_0440 [Hydrogenobaculum sp. Y04AAS1]HCT66471.1 DUF465 domain-containing protein [Hydrogenobaculum sp.]
MDRKAVEEKLYKEDRHYRHLKDKHDELDKEIMKMEKHRPMTSDLELQIEAIKKERLKLKDEMELIVVEYMKKHGEVA